MDVLQIINLSLFGLVIIMILIFVLIGLLRGVRKTLFRSLWLLVTAVVLFFVTPLLTRLVVNADYSFLNIPNFTSIPDYLLSLIEEPKYVDAINANPLLKEVILTLPTLLINTLLFTILFWISLFLFWPIWAILSFVFFKKKDKNGNKRKKYRLGGAAIGLVTGLLVAAITTMPVLNTLNLAVEIENDTKQEGETGGLISKAAELAGYSGQYGTITDWSETYSNFYVHYLFRYTGMEFLSKVTYNGLTSTKIGNQKLSLTDDLKSVAQVASLALSLQGTDFSNIDQATITKTLDIADKVIDEVFKSGIINIVGPELMTFILEGLESGDPDFIIPLNSLGDANMDALLHDAIVAFKSVSFADLKSDLKNLVGAIKVLNRCGIISKVMANTGLSDIRAIQAITNSFDEASIIEFSDKLGSMKTATQLLPIALNAVLSYGANALGISGFDATTNIISGANIQSMIKDILKVAIACVNSLDPDSSYYVGEDSLPLIGQLFDIIENCGVLTADNYQLFLGAIIDKAKEQINAITGGSDEGIMTSVLDSVGDVLDRLKNVDDFSFEEDFTLINVAFTDIMTLLEAFAPVSEPEEPVLPLFADDDNEPSILPNLDYSGLGRILDSLKPTYLFGPELNNIIRKAIDFAVEMVPSDMVDLSAVASIIKGNLSNDVSWEDELPRLENMITFLQEKMTDVDTFKANIGTLLPELGVIFDDNLSESVLFDKALPRLIFELFSIIRSTFEDQLGDHDGLLAILDRIQDKTIDDDTYSEGNWISWESEFTRLATAFDYFLNNNDLLNIQPSDLGSLLDELTLSAYFGSEVNNLVIEFINIVREAFGASVPTMIDNALTAVNANVARVPDIGFISWTVEMQYMQELVNLFRNAQGVTTEPYLDDVGPVLDSIKDSFLIGSELPGLVADYLGELTASYRDDYGDLIENIQQNIVTFGPTASWSWTFELDRLQLLQDFLEGSSIDNLASVGQLLDSVSDSLCIGSEIPSFAGDRFDDEVSKLPLTMQDDYEDIIGSIGDNIRNNSGGPTWSWETELVILKDFIDFLNSGDTDDLSDVGAALDAVLAGNLVSRNAVITTMQSEIDNLLEGDDDNDITAIVNDIKSNLHLIDGSSELVTFEIELGKLEVLVDFLDSGDTNDLGAVGRTLDAIIGTLVTRNSVIDLINSKIDEKIIDSDLEDIVNVIKANLYAVDGVAYTFETQLAGLDDFVTEVVDVIPSGNSATEFIDFGVVLDNYDNNVLIAGDGETYLDARKEIIFYLLDSFAPNSEIGNEIDFADTIRGNTDVYLSDPHNSYEDFFTELYDVFVAIEELSEVTEATFDSTTHGNLLTRLKDSPLVGPQNAQSMSVDIIRQFGAENPSTSSQFEALALQLEGETPEDVNYVYYCEQIEQLLLIV